MSDKEMNAAQSCLAKFMLIVIICTTLVVTIYAVMNGSSLLKTLGIAISTYISSFCLILWITVGFTITVIGLLKGDI